MNHQDVGIGYQVFLSDGGEEVGAVRAVKPNGRAELVIYVENAGDFTVPFSAIHAVHAQKIVLDAARISPELRLAIGHAHDSEVQGL